MILIFRMIKEIVYAEIQKLNKNIPLKISFLLTHFLKIRRNNHTVNQ